MANKKSPSSKPTRVERQESDPFESAARVQEETSNDGRFSTYEVARKKDPRDGDLILQHRGAPQED